MTNYIDPETGEDITSWLQDAIAAVDGYDITLEGSSPNNNSPQALATILKKVERAMEQLTKDKKAAEEELDDALDRESRNHG